MTTKIGYFTAGITPTEDEAAEIAKLEAMVNPDYQLVVRCATADGKYGDNIESLDLKAGSPGTDFAAVTETKEGEVDRPSLFELYCQGSGVSSGNPITLIPIAVEASNAFDLESTQIAPDDSSLAWESSNEAAATVADGVVTYVGAGATTITCTYTYATGKTIAATFDVTVS